MRNKTYIYNLLMLLFVCCTAILSCTDMEDKHEEYLLEGEQIYVGRPWMVYTNSGDERIKFNIIISSDPKISKGVVSWNNDTESHDFTVSRVNETFDTVVVEIQIPEGSYAFDITLMDDAGNSSLTFEHSAVVYGDKYATGLLNRGVSGIEALPGKATISWANSENGVVSTIFSYENNEGVMKEITVLPTEFETVINDYKLGGSYTVTTMYKPDPSSLDEFSSAADSGEFPATVLLDRSQWLKVVLPTDAPLACYGGSIENLWDGNKGSWYHSGCTDADKIPHHFTIDFGVLAGVSKFRVTPRQECCQGRNPKKFQIWGTQDLDGAETTLPTGDPSWEDEAIEKGWVLLADVVAPDSWNGSKDDLDIEIAENIPVQYIRFRFLEAFVDEGGQTALSEFNFWAREIQ